MIFDTHVHLGLKAFFSPPPSVNTVELPILNNARESRWNEYVRQAEKQSIAKALVFPFPLPYIQTAKANDYVLKAASCRPDLFLPMLLISNDISQLCQHKSQIAGAKEEFYLQGAREPHQFTEAYDFLQQHNLILMIHPHWEDRISRIKKIIKNFPKLRIILAHSGRKWPFTGEDVIEMILPVFRKYENLIFDTSTIRDSKVIRALVEKAGAHRVIFGSDYPFYKTEGECVYSHELDTIKKSGIKEDDMHRVLCQNFKDILLPETYLRRALRDDLVRMAEIVAEISIVERKHLAIDKKIETFRSNIKVGRHVYLLEGRDGIIAFMRESGRPNNAAMIEELYVLPQYRNRGHGTNLLRIAQGMFPELEAKTFANNINMNSSLVRSGFKLVHKGSKILQWIWNNA